MITRADHMQWAKTRALEYLEQPSQQLETDQVLDAWSSLVSDLSKHPETQGHPGIMLGTRQMMGGHLGTASAMRDYIKGFN